ncbi:TetR/AcrR family transcriptional regulator [Vibrio sp. SCSIO 43136]|uniref:TetR/AcrR family transcriptional regulator n=1 Tax=Vibrio sp. SCSIO 43136 TaxID=2819101 RepID=UPI002074EE7D|nr:TetR/AcrR family transcriptional regulator [Vibrio sp. SCSIO 43136]USD66802.1 TetR/AcrR family transcriptional regulator [Vibrio sp. SCSIO 43136]
MPKRSKEDTEITIQTIMDAVVDQLIHLGYDKMSYTTLSQQTGISRTGISHHFPKKTDFTASLDSRIYQMFLSHLNLSSDVAGFRQSWINALESREFTAILKLIFHHTVSSENTHPFAKAGLDRIYGLVENQFGSDAKNDLDALFGRSIVHMAS